MALPAPGQREPEASPASAEGYNGDGTQTTTARPPRTQLPEKGLPHGRAMPPPHLLPGLSPRLPLARCPSHASRSRPSPSQGQQQLGEGTSSTPGGRAAMQGPWQRDACSSAGSERGRARAGCLPGSRLGDPGACPRCSSPVLPRARGSATAARRFPPPAQALCSLPASSAPRPRALPSPAGSLAPKLRGWGAPGQTAARPSLPRPGSLGGLHGLPSVRGAKGTGRAAASAPQSGCLLRRRAERNGERAGESLAFSPSRHARQKRLTKTRGVNKNGWRTEPNLDRKEGWRRTGRNRQPSCPAPPHDPAHAPLPAVPSDAREDKERATTLQILKLAGDRTGGRTPVQLSASSGSEESPTQSRSTAEMSECVL